MARPSWMAVLLADQLKGFKSKFECGKDTFIEQRWFESINVRDANFEQSLLLNLT